MTLERRKTLKTRKSFRILSAALALAAALYIAQTITCQEEGEVKPVQTGVVSYVGTDKCLMCHANKKDKWAGNPHSVNTANVSQPELSGCEACHGEGSLHVEANGAKPHIKVPSNLDKNEASAICSKCHGGANPSVPKEWRTFNDVDWRKTMHFKKDVKCVDCHEIHGDNPGMLKSQKPVELCKNCHGDLLKGASGYVHAPVKMGKCLDCHDPHGGGGLPHMVKKSVKDECAKCHATDKPKMIEAHGGFNTTGSACQGCHNPHATDRSRKLLYNDEHTIFKPRKCEMCHKEKKENGAPAAMDVKELCTKCHSSVISQAEGMSHKHFPVVQGLCTNCHSPHVANNKTMLKDSTDNLCGTCHKKVEEQLAGMYEHPPVATGICSTCHTAHGNNTEKFLKTDPNELCKSCHEKINFSHPMVEQTKNPDMGPIIRCYTCHAVHGSSIKKLLPWDMVTLCNKCHKKDVTTTVTPEDEEGEYKGFNK